MTHIPTYDDQGVPAEFPLPEPYADNTPQDVADALRDHCDFRMDGPLLDYLALAGAALIERQQAEIRRLEHELAEAVS